MYIVVHGCRGPTGPWTDSSAQPLLSSDAVAAGPGRCFVPDLAGGSSMMFFHAWQLDAIGFPVPGRQLLPEPLEWVGGRVHLMDGPPDVATPLVQLDHMQLPPALAGRRQQAGCAR